MLRLSSLLLLRRTRHVTKPFSTTTTTATDPPPPPPLLSVPLSHPIYLIWSSNTSLGKTLVSTGLAASSLLRRRHSSFLYLKPVQTGFPSDSDSRFVFSKLTSLALRRRLSPLLASHHVLKASSAAAASLLAPGASQNYNSGMCDLNWSEERRVSGENDEPSKLVCKTMYAWGDAVSPHLAAEREDGTVGDSALLEMMQRCMEIGAGEEKMEHFCVVETAGGVASPGPSGSLQCDLYRPFRLPAILVGDGRLGGISGTISAYETLKLRGYDVVAVILEDHGLVNEIPLASYLRNSVPVLVLPPVPQDLSNDLMEWYDEAHNVFDSLMEIMLSAYSERIKRLRDMPKRAVDVFWWPFTQHTLVPEGNVTVIDSRCGENFAVFQNDDAITEQFDACASWWTQGPDATLQTELARDIGYAAARFGHVMFPENVYEPALECAELLLEGVGKDWASRTYFSDNGSTAIEIALKMAFRKYSHDHGLFLESLKDNSRFPDLVVLALNGSYHGDTLGAMEAQAPSCYTGFLQQPWYSGRGFFLDPPTVFLSKNMWHLSLPEGLHSPDLNVKNLTFCSRDDILNKSRDKSDLAEIYSSFISHQLSKFPESKGLIGALIIEPVIQGAGGLHMVDPLFQRILVNECRNKNIPVIFDEVFTGFWRLGTESAAELLCCFPDIACFGKLMTGGTVPLSATLATDAVFNSFIGDSKLKALLHGHSYTAHAIGCTAAAKSIRWYKDSDRNPNISSKGSLLKELWDDKLVYQISSHPAIKRVVVLGTLCAIELQADGHNAGKEKIYMLGTLCAKELQADGHNAGYGSLYATSLLKQLREDGVYMRPLGNVIYLMCGPCTSPKICNRALRKVYRRLDKFSQTQIN